MRFILDEADWLPPEVRAKLLEQNPNRVNKNGEFMVQSESFRTQGGNYAACIDRLHESITLAAFVPKETSEEKLERIAEL
ncbi:hypothetical protein HDV00_002734 [Rhizophlyctis rosea]|nr:hypothetical protein HDV00_002734 [Rhizophlyctis rosea]